MTAATPDADDLKHIAMALQAEPDDLALNRAGKLSPRQAGRLGVDEASARVEHADGSIELRGDDGERSIAVGGRELADVGSHRGALEGFGLRVYYLAGANTIVNAEPIPGAAVARTRLAPGAVFKKPDPDTVEREAMGQLGKVLLLFAIVPAFFALGMLYIDEEEAVAPLFATAGAFVGLGLLAYLRQLWVAWISIVVFALLGVGVVVFVAATASDLSNFSFREVGKVIFAYGAGALFVGLVIPYLIKVQVIDRVRNARRAKDS